MLTDSQKLDLILEGLTGVNVRLDRVEQRLDRVDARIGGLEQRMDALEQRIGGLEQRMGSLEKRMDSLEIRVNGFDLHLTLELDKMRLENAQGFRAMRQELTDELSVTRRDFNKEILAIREVLEEHFKHFTATVFNLGEHLAKRTNALEERFLGYWDKALTAMDASAKQYENFAIEKAALTAGLDRHEAAFTDLKAYAEKQNGAMQDLQARVVRIETSPT